MIQSHERNIKPLRAAGNCGMKFWLYPIKVTYRRFSVNLKIPINSRLTTSRNHLSPEENFRLLVSSNPLFFGTDPDRNGALEETPRSWTDSCRWLNHFGVRAPYETRRKRRYEANKCGWTQLTFISQGSRSWGKLAVETWRVKTELIIITILHITTTTTSILNLGFKTITPKILAHTKMHK